MDNIKERKCAKCKKNDCNANLNYFATIVAFNNDRSKCSIIKERWSRKQFVEVLKNNKPALHDESTDTILIPRKMNNLRGGYRIDNPNGFIIIAFYKWDAHTDYIIINHFNKWINNMILHGRFNDDNGIDNYVPKYASTKRFIKLYEEYSKLKISFYKALYNA